jgi:hypothetical protein
VYDPTQAVPSRGGLQDAVSRLTTHRDAPFAFWRQQVTNPGRPQLDRVAHCTTERTHALDSDPCVFRSLATARAQRT